MRTIFFDHISSAICAEGLHFSAFIDSSIIHCIMYSSQAHKTLQIVTIMSRKHTHTFRILHIHTICPHYAHVSSNLIV